MKKTPYDSKYLIQKLIILFLMIGLCKLTMGSAIILVAPLLIAAQVSHRHEDVIFWMLFLIGSVAINYYFLPKGNIYGISQRAIVLTVGIVGFVQLAAQVKSKIVTSMLLMLVYLVYECIPSSMGWWPLVSFLKLALFSTVFMALAATTNSSMINNRTDLRKIRSVILCFAILFIFGSIMLIPFPALSQLKWELMQEKGMTTSLFAGMSIHSQSLGPIVVALATILMADLLFGVQKADKLYLTLLSCVPIIIYKTSSRTAMLTLIFIALYMGSLLLKTRKVSSKWKSKVVSSSTSIVILLAALALCLPVIQNGIARYLVKWDADAKISDLTWETATKSRMGPMERAWTEFKKRPFIGSGFQVDERLVLLNENRSGLMLSAPIEKGVWITAILEEGGVIGFLLYLVFVAQFYFTAKKMRYYISMSSFVVVHLLNMGEFTLFSMSGNGGICWALMFASMILDKLTINQSSDRRKHMFYTCSAPLPMRRFR